MASIRLLSLALGACVLASPAFAQGVSGAPGGDKDTACAKAGIAKIADRMK